MNDSFEEWPTLHVKLHSPGAYLYTSNGEVACIIKADGSKQWIPNMENKEISFWEIHGVFDPTEIINLETKVEDLIKKLSSK